jgi:hypothetical protein
LNFYFLSRSLLCPSPFTNLYPFSLLHSSVYIYTQFPHRFNWFFFLLSSLSLCFWMNDLFSPEGGYLCDLAFFFFTFIRTVLAECSLTYGDSLRYPLLPLGWLAARMGSLMDEYMEGLLLLRATG